MTVGEDIGAKSIINVKANNNIEGFIVQDLKDSEGKIVRQIIFENKYDQIQSEMQIVFRDPKKHELQPHELANSEFGKKKGKEGVLNFDFLTSEYQAAMLSGLHMVPSLGYEKDQKLNILHLGTGAGILPTFLVS